MQEVISNGIRCGLERDVMMVGLLTMRTVTYHLNLIKCTKHVAFNAILRNQQKSVAIPTK